MKNRMKRGCCLWLALALLLTVPGALAAPTQTFGDMLADIGMSPTDAQGQTHVIALTESQQALGVNLSLEGLYFDGQYFLLGWKTNNTEPSQPVLVLYQQLTVGGVSLDADADFPLSQWWPNAFGLFVAGDPINNLMGNFHTSSAKDYGLHGKQEITASFMVKRPQKPIVVVDAEIGVPYEDQDTETDRQAMLKAMKDCGVTIAQPGDMDVETWRERGYVAVDQYGDLLNSRGTTDDQAALNGVDWQEADTAEVTLRFTADLDALAGTV